MGGLEGAAARDGRSWERHSKTHGQEGALASLSMEASVLLRLKPPIRLEGGPPSSPGRPEVGIQLWLT